MKGKLVKPLPIHIILFRTLLPSILNVTLYAIIVFIISIYLHPAYLNMFFGGSGLGLILIILALVKNKPEYDFKMLWEDYLE